MDDHIFLHDNELLLCSMHPSRALLVRMWLRGIVESALIGFVVSVVIGVAWWFATQNLLPWYAYAAIFALILVLVCMRHWQLWKKCLFRITTDRILFSRPHSLMANTSKTIKWSQYQESNTAHATILEFLFRVRGLCIRYGNLDAHDVICFPALPYANDIKHYLDKVDSMVKNKQIEGLRPFVAKPKGQRG